MYYTSTTCLSQVSQLSSFLIPIGLCIHPCNKCVTNIYHVTNSLVSTLINKIQDLSTV